MLTDSFIRVTWLIFMCTARRHRLDYDRQLTRDLDICTWRDWLIYQSQVICHMTYVTWLNYMYDMTHFYVEHLAAIVFAMAGSSLVASKDVCNMTHSYGSFVWLIHMYIWRDSFQDVMVLIYVCKTWQKSSWQWRAAHLWLRNCPTARPCLHSQQCRLCDVTHSYVHDSLKPVTWPFTCMPWALSCVWRDSSISVPWLLHMGDVTHLKLSSSTPMPACAASAT